MATDVQRSGSANNSRGVPARGQDDLRVNKPPEGYGVAQSLSQRRRTGGHSDGSLSAWTPIVGRIYTLGSLLLSSLPRGDCVAGCICGW